MSKTVPARTRKVVVLAAFVASTLVAAAGAAWAANVQCVVGQPCVGTNQADTITGTGQFDGVFALGGRDIVLAKNGDDYVVGDKGPDTVKGGLGNDEFLWGGTEGEGTYPDESDDEVYGGKGRDYIIGGRGQGGVDELYGEEGDDTLVANQRGFPADVEVTKEVLDCGPGRDTAFFDRGLDVVRANCEVRNPPLRAGDLPSGIAPSG